MWANQASWEGEGKEKTKQHKDNINAVFPMCRQGGGREGEDYKAASKQDLCPVSQA